MKRTTALMLLLVLCLLLGFCCACQPTPEEEIVIGKTGAQGGAIAQDDADAPAVPFAAPCSLLSFEDAAGIADVQKGTSENLLTNGCFFTIIILLYFYSVFAGSAIPSLKERRFCLEKRSAHSYDL